MSNIVICVSLEKDLQEILKRLNKNFVQGQNVHLLHVFEHHYYVNEFTLVEYPSDEQKENIHKSVIGILDELKTEFDPEGKANSVKTVCLFDSNPKNCVVEYLKEVKADTCVTATRGKHGLENLFDSSFTDHLVKFSPCDLYVLRPH